MIQFEVAPWDEDLPPHLRAQIHARLAGILHAEQGRLRLFRDCLRILIELGLREAQARSLLGRWRRDHGDVLVIEAVRRAAQACPSDPAAFVSATLARLRQEASRSMRLLQHQYQLLGWERPAMTEAGPRYRHGQRGQVWITEYGTTVVLPAPAGVTIPNHEVDPGVPADIPRRP